MLLHERNPRSRPLKERKSLLVFISERDAGVEPGINPLEANVHQTHELKASELLAGDRIESVLLVLGSIVKARSAEHGDLEGDRPDPL